MSDNLADRFLWPPDFEPEKCPVHAHNELRIAAPPELVWNWLIHATSWPEWYSNSEDVRFESPPGPDLALGTKFNWKTFGVRIGCVVKDFVPNEYLSWQADFTGGSALHAWAIEGQDDGCLVVTEETQHGSVPDQRGEVMRDGLLKYHQAWLEGLAAQCAKGPPQ